ncbi:MAG TPA: DUF362 domain-containing protein, partial [Minicystis sp.]|nr:DUF362 domain-containing protein [Minicystis sp.]
EGGDEFDRRRGLADAVEDKLSRLPLPLGHSLVVRAPAVGRPPKVIDGSWEGNRTLYRTVLDLNTIVHYADRDGALRDAPQRRVLAIVDGVVAGEGEGPLGAAPVDAGLLVGGFDPALVDVAATRAMGLDPLRVPMIAAALAGALLASTRLEELDEVLDGPRPTRRFRAPRSWPSLA